MEVFLLFFIALFLSILIGYYGSVIENRSVTIIMQLVSIFCAASISVMIIFYLIFSNNIFSW